MSLKINIDIKQTLKLKDETRKRFSKYSKMYIMTTENIDGYYKNFDFKNKTVLTVTSSYDHALNAILYGAKKVKTFDINRLSYYIANLKLAAVKTLDYNEYIEYFLSNQAFNYKTYKKIQTNLNKKVAKYFDKIYKYFEYNGKAIKESFLFHHGHKNYKEDNTYLLNENNYKTLKKKIKNIEVEFINTSILKIVKQTKKDKYDIIILSNISDYAKNIFKKNYLKQYFNFIKKDIIKILKSDGKIQVAYIYDYGNDKEVRSDINIKEKRDEIITKEFKTKKFKSTIKKLEKDAIIIYEGEKKYGK